MIMKKWQKMIINTDLVFVTTAQKCKLKYVNKQMLLLTCFFYLLGVVIILYFKPELMFDKDGMWKEFGLTLNEKHTWFPFWLFCILWAILCYSVISYFFDSPSGTSTPYQSKKTNKNSMKPGYYVLDKQASKEEGFPKYIFLGSETPED